MTNRGDSRPLVLGDTLADLHTRSPSTITCGSCGHSASLDVWSLATKVGWDLPVTELLPKLKCSVCGARQTTLATPRA
jgi:transcription elongation factor Elf1